jgi:hypothetical protein
VRTREPFERTPDERVTAADRVAQLEAALQREREWRQQADARAARLEDALRRAWQVAGRT